MNAFAPASWNGFGAPRRPPRHPALKGGLGVLAIVETFSNGMPTPCAYIRVIRPLEIAAAAGLLSFALVSEKAALRYTADILLTHRSAVGSLDAAGRLIDHCRAHEIGLVYDLDDNFFAMLGEQHAALAFESLKVVSSRFLVSADEVWVSTPYLASHVADANASVFVALNGFDKEVWSRGRAREPSSGADDTCRILYTGTITHADDFEIARRALGELVRRHGKTVEFFMYGVSATHYPESWIKRLELRPHCAIFPVFAEAMSSMARFDIGIGPLRESEFNKAKSAIKFIDYAAIGAVPVVSDGEPYRDIVVHGINGLLVENSTQSWFAALDGLVRDPSLRERLKRGAWRTICETSDMRALARIRYERLASLRAGGSGRPGSLGTAARTS